MTKIFRSTFLFLFFGLLLMLCFRARFAADDFFFMHLRETHGIWGGMITQYVSFSGRWASHLVSNLLLSFSSIPFFLPVFFISTFVILYFVLSALFYKIFVRTDVDERDFNSDYAPLIFLISLFFTTNNTGEIWFWFISTTNYLWSLIAMITIGNFLLGKKDTNFKWILLTLCSLYVGGASESMAISFLLILLIAGTYQVYKEGKNNFFNSLFGKFWLAATILIIISLGISALAPGTANRLELLPHVSFGGKLLALIKSFVKVFSRYLTGYGLLLILFSIPWMTFGFFIQQNHPMRLKNIIRLAGKFSLAYLILLLIVLSPVAFILSETGPARALFPVTVVSAAYFATIFTLFGMIFRHNKITDKIVYAHFLIAITFTCFHLFKQYNSTLIFDNRYDERIEQIEAAQKSDPTSVLEVPSLADPGMLFNAEISTDTSYFVNQHWRMRYGVTLKLIK